jgi:hypothetical protein
MEIWKGRKEGMKEEKQGMKEVKRHIPYLLAYKIKIFS